MPRAPLPRNHKRERRFGASPREKFGLSRHLQTQFHRTGQVVVLHTLHAQICAFCRFAACPSQKEKPHDSHKRRYSPAREPDKMLASRDFSRLVCIEQREETCASKHERSSPPMRITFFRSFCGPCARQQKSGLFARAPPQQRKLFRERRFGASRGKFEVLCPRKRIFKTKLAPRTHPHMIPETHQNMPYNLCSPMALERQRSSSSLLDFPAATCPKNTFSHLPRIPHTPCSTLQSERKEACVGSASKVPARSAHDAHGARLQRQPASTFVTDYTSRVRTPQILAQHDIIVDFGHAADHRRRAADKEIWRAQPRPCREQKASKSASGTT